MFEKQRIHLGLFVYPQHASDIRSLAAAILFQEFANLPEPINSQIDVLRGLQRPDLTTKQSSTEFRRWLNRFYAIMHSDPSIWPVETESPPEPDDYN